MTSIDPKVIDFVLTKIDSGFIFEEFANAFIAATDGIKFIPIGGIKDKGIDGLEFTLGVENKIDKQIYQFSIEKNPKSKIQKTLLTLSKNQIKCKIFIYVTNVIVKDQNFLIEEFYDSQGVMVQIRDLNWIKVNINTPQTAAIFHRFEKNYIYEYNKPDKVFELVDTKDPRIYVYLRQEVDRWDHAANLDELLVDSLIFLSLDDTDPNQGILRRKEEIISLISEISSFDHNWLDEMVTRRLKALSSKPLRKIKHHRQTDEYTLPYETRFEIVNRQIEDSSLYQDFRASTLQLLEQELQNSDINVEEPYNLLEAVFHSLFKQQGLEFSQFVSTGDGSLSIDKFLKEIVSKTVDNFSMHPRQRKNLKSALLNTIRNIVYRGTESQLEFLRRLSNTYRMLFLLRFDPKLATYFETMVSTLCIYVDNSIIVPALSEYFLDEKNKRYTNLLLAARDVGVKMIVNNTIIQELAAHLRSIQRVFFDVYEDHEDLYSDETAIVYIPEILIRAYFYAKLSEKVDSFHDFIETFVSWNMTNIVTELVEWVGDAFGMTFEETTNLNLSIDYEQEQSLFEELKKVKNGEKQARNDAKQLLMLYAIRKQNNELGNSGIFGYKTWWLTSDTNSQIAFRKISDESTEHSSPYIRADFLYNYISLAPSKRQIDSIYKKVFPTLLGVNISFHVPEELCNIIQENMLRHEKLVVTPRFRGKLRQLNEQLKSDPAQWDRRKLNSWFDERVKEVTSGN